jgi:hypothetical protein
MPKETAAQVGLGCHVEVELIDEQGNSETLAFDIVEEDAADFERGSLSVDAPLSKAIRGKFVGNVIAYRMGDIRNVHILSVGPAQKPTTDDASERRRAVLEEARRKAERTNSEMFAASYSGKWGDYSTDDVPPDTPQTDDM